MIANQSLYRNVLFHKYLNAAHGQISHKQRAGTQRDWSLSHVC